SHLDRAGAQDHAGDRHGRGRIDSKGRVAGNGDRMADGEGSTKQLQRRAGVHRQPGGDIAEIGVLRNDQRGTVGEVNVAGEGVDAVELDHAAARHDETARATAALANVPYDLDEVVSAAGQDAVGEIGEVAGSDENLVAVADGDGSVVREFVQAAYHVIQVQRPGTRDGVDGSAAVENNRDPVSIVVEEERGPCD